MRLRLGDMIKININKIFCICLYYCQHNTFNDTHIPTPILLSILFAVTKFTKPFYQSVKYANVLNNFSVVLTQADVQAHCQIYVYTNNLSCF